jgi:hypothetical protein
MARKPYILRRPATKALNNVTALAVFAEDAAQAKAIANDYAPQDVLDAWSNVTPVEITSAVNTWVGWTFNARVRAVTTGAIIADVAVTADATTDTIDEIGAALVTALNATTINNASYASNVLTLAAIADDIGTATVEVSATGPGGRVIPGIWGAVVHQGIAGAALTAAMPADADIAPVVVAVSDGSF